MMSVDQMVDGFSERFSERKGTFQAYKRKVFDGVVLQALFFGVRCGTSKKDITPPRKGGRDMKRTWCDWLPATPWTYVNCGAVVVTKEISPMCSVCGYREGL